MHTKFWYGNLNEKDYFSEDLGIHETTMLNWILEYLSPMTWTEFLWLGKGRWWAPVNTVMNLSGPQKTELP
jgi:hypothetical protein